MRRLFSFIVFFGMLTLFVGGAHYFVYQRLVVAPGWGETVQTAGAFILAGLTIGGPGSLIAARRLGRERGGALARAAYMWLGAIFLLVSLLGLGELVRLLLGALQVGEPARSRAIGIGTMVATGIALAYGLWRATGAVPVKRVEVTLPRLPAGASGYRLVQLSDVHIGPLLGREWLGGVVDRVNALEPDAVVITGDLVDGSVQELAEHVAPLADLSSRQGTYFVTGNHEYYAGADAWLAELRRLGVKPLRNERVELGRDDATFDLAGVDDVNAFGPGHGPDLERALEGRDPEREVVLLAHQPRQFAAAAAAGVGLQLSGHTHGGQIVPWNLFVRLQQPHVAGLTRSGDAQLYTSRGTGFWGPPLRVGAPPEITLLTLVSPAA